MRKRHERDPLAEAIARLKKQGAAEPLPQDVVDETASRIADCGLQTADSRSGRLSPPGSHVRIFPRVAAAAVLLLAGYLAGRAASPDVEQLRKALTPAVAASIEPALRQRLSEELQGHYQAALTGTYVRLKDELGQQYRDDLNRFAVQTLAASNATTNALLSDLVKAIDTTQARDQQRIALILSQIEAQRVQDRTQLANGLINLASHAETEFSHMKKVLSRSITDERPQDVDWPRQAPEPTLDERNDK